MSTEPLDLIIVGAGPAGVEAALQADAKGLSYVLLDKDIAGSLIDRTMSGKRFFHEYGRNKEKPTGLIEFPDHSMGGELVKCWHKQLEGKNYKETTEVYGIEKQGELFKVATSSGDMHAKYVVLSSGTFASPRMLGVPGEEGNERVVHQFDYGHDYGDGPFIVVGGGNSALEAAIELGFDQKVSMLIRKDSFHESATQNNKDEVQEHVDDGNVSIKYNSVVKKIEGGVALVDVNGGEENIEFNKIFVHIGYLSPTEFLKACGLELKGDAPAFNETFASSVPGLYISGSLTGADSVIESANQSHQIIDQIAKDLGR